MTAVVAAVVAERVLVEVDSRNTTVGMAAGLAMGVIAWSDVLGLIEQATKYGGWFGNGGDCMGEHHSARRHISGPVSACLCG